MEYEGGEERGGERMRGEMEKGTQWHKAVPLHCIFPLRAALHRDPLGNNQEQTRAQTCKAPPTPPQPGNQKLWRCAQAH